MSLRSLQSVRGGAVFAALATICSAQLQSTLIPATGLPPAMREVGSAYDAVRDLTVTFGGLRLGQLRNEIYEFDGANWAISSVFPRPGPRGMPALAFDAARGHVLVFGGVTATSTFLADTWAFDGPTFTQLQPTVSPGARSGAHMAFDPTRGVVVMFGGFVASGLDANDTWEWNGSTWAQMSPPSSPSPRGAHRLVFDARRGDVVLFGGFRTPSQTTLADTWSWNGSAWTAVSTTATPPSRCDQALVYDPLRQRTVMFGGLTAFQQPGNVPVTLGDFWVLGTNGWQSKSVPGLPSSRSGVIGVFDVANEGILLHGGFDSVATTMSDSYALESLSPADMQSYGAGCVGSNGVPVLAADSSPWLADFYQVSVTNVPTSSAGFLTLGLSDTVWNSLPVPVDLTSFGLPGCQAWLGPDFSVLFLIQNGRGSWGTTVCNCPFAIGLSYSLQAVVLDPGAPTPLGGSMSNALRATIGSW